MKVHFDIRYSLFDILRFAFELHHESRVGYDLRVLSRLNLKRLVRDFPHHLRKVERLDSR
jgi:hypothetical protein